MDQMTERDMPQFAETCKWLDAVEVETINEPEPEELGFCSDCDVEIFLPRQTAGLCPACEGQENAR